MRVTQRVVFIISDLHIGGRYPKSNEPGKRGFRINTHVDALTKFVSLLAKQRDSGVDVELVINGDFLDFLAEESPKTDAHLPFIEEELDAITTLRRIVKQDQALFDAIKDFAGLGGRLTFLLGNHDVELSLPHVRRELYSILGLEGLPWIKFIYDGEAYAIGDALIEHGNRYDGFNVIDYDGLRELRSLQSRGQRLAADEILFSPPPGSGLVASIMNPIKKDYAFVDLLKPETEAVIPLLLALEPQYRDRLPEIATLKFWADLHAPRAPGMPRYKGDLAATKQEKIDAGERARAIRKIDVDDVAAFRSLLTSLLSAEAAAKFAQSFLDMMSTATDASGDKRRNLWGVARLLTADKSKELEDRLPDLLDAVRILHNDRSFDRSKETGKTYLAAANEFVRNGFRFVIFGHTHLAKEVSLERGGTYLNSGTWADLMEFPKEIVQPDNAQAMDKLRAFVADLAAGHLDPYIKFEPTYVRLNLRGDRVESAILRDFDCRADNL